jgi:hypothetical protein
LVEIVPRQGSRRELIADGSTRFMPGPRSRMRNREAGDYPKTPRLFYLPEWAESRSPCADEEAYNHEDAQGSAATGRPGCPVRDSPGRVCVALRRDRLLELLSV